MLAKLIHDKLKDDPRITKHIRSLDIKTQRPTYDVRGGETLYSDSYVGQKLGAAAVKAIKNRIPNGMAVVNYNEKGEIEFMSIEEVINPRSVHLRVVDLFEQSGVYCFGRKPDESLYVPISFVPAKPQ